MHFLAEPGELRRLLRTLLHSFLYLFFCGVVFIILHWLTVWPAIVFDNYSKKWEILFLGLMMINAICFGFLETWFAVRFLTGIHHIFDHQRTVGEAILEAKKCTYKNAWAIFGTFFMNYIAFYFLCIFTLGAAVLVALPYLTCFLTVVYALTTNQCEQVTQTDEEW